MKLRSWLARRTAQFRGAPPQEPHDLPPRDRRPRQLPLQGAIVVPFVLQIALAVGLTGWFSLRNGQRAVDDLAARLQASVSAQIDRHLDDYFSVPPALNEINLAAFELGILDLTDFETVGQYFWKQMQTYDVGYINYGTVEGDFIGVERLADGSFLVLEDAYDGRPGLSNIYEIDDRGRRTAIVEIQGINEYDHREEAWFADVAAAREPLWSAIYPWEDKPEVLSISSSYPVFDRQGQFLGVIGVDRLISRLNQFLRAIDASHENKEFTTFIWERDGTLVASSSDAPIAAIADGQARRLSVLESEDPRLVAVAQYVRDDLGGFAAVSGEHRTILTAGDRRYFVRVASWQDGRGLDWLTAVAIPRDAFMGQIHANTRTTIALCLLALAVATALGLGSARWIARPIADLVDASEAIARGELDRRGALSGGRAWQIRELRRLGDAFDRMAAQLAASFARLEQANADLEGRVRDRTRELETAKQAADAANRAKSEFLANMSHELRTPLNGILGYAQILGRDRATSPAHGRGLRVIEQCGQHLLGLIDDVLDLAKIEARKLDLNPRLVRLPEVLASVTAMCGIKADEKGLDFTLALSDRLPEGVVADDKRLRQVLANLLGNAIKFTEAGRVGLTVAPADGSPYPWQPGDRARLIFVVEDTGIGMTPEELAQLFRPFEQVGDLSRRAEGTGLGLAISQRFVELMGSRIVAESEPGRGSRFSFALVLPVAELPVLPGEPRPRPRPLGYVGDRRTVLVVDDREENRQVLRELLVPLGFRVVEAEDGQQGLERALAERPDAIVTDLVMPVISGYELVQHLRDRPEFHTTPILASSASRIDFERDLLLKNACQGFLGKPIVADDLLDWLARVLGLSWIEAGGVPGEAERDRRESAIDSGIDSGIDSDIDSDRVGTGAIGSGSAGAAPSPDPADLAPPEDILADLRAALEIGDIGAIEARALDLKARDRRYEPFADRLLESVARFDEAGLARALAAFAPAQ